VPLNRAVKHRPASTIEPGTFSPFGGHPPRRRPVERGIDVTIVAVLANTAKALEVKRLDGGPPAR